QASCQREILSRISFVGQGWAGFFGAPGRGFRGDTERADRKRNWDDRDDQAGLGPPLDTVAWVAGAMRSSLGNTVTLRSSRAASGCIEQCPSNCAPSWMLRRGAARLPTTLAEGRISIFCVPVMSPLTFPPTTIAAALICAVTTAVSPMWRLSF